MTGASRPPSVYHAMNKALQKDKMVPDAFPQKPAREFNFAEQHFPQKGKI